MSDEEEAGRGFTTKDRRMFDSDGNLRGNCDDSVGEKTSASNNQSRNEDNSRPLPDLDFSAFVLSLSTSAMMNMGDTPLPDGTMKKDLPLAKQTIDILGLLQEKTKGNLTEDEDKLLTEILYGLRMRYVAITK